MTFTLLEPGIIHSKRKVQPAFLQKELYSCNDKKMSDNEQMQAIEKSTLAINTIKRIIRISCLTEVESSRNVMQICTVNVLWNTIQLHITRTFIVMCIVNGRITGFQAQNQIKYICN